MPTATMTSKGQITVPSEIRRSLRVKAGDELDFQIDDNGEVRVSVARADIRDLKGLLHQPRRRSVSLLEMERAILRRGQP